MIDTREELVNALTEAAELEHGLLLQYLFAAYSMKKRRDEGLGGVEQEAVRRWEGVITAVARDEMAHLGSVCNLLSAIGGAPRFGRPNFPQPHGRYYPFDFRLMRFAADVLAASREVLKKEDAAMADIAAGKFISPTLDARLAAAGFRILED